MNRKQYTVPARSQKGADRELPEFSEKVVEISRVSRAVKGGNRIRFRALVVVGNKNGKVGYGIGKSAEITNAIKKAVKFAKRDMVEIPITSHGSIPYQIDYSSGSAHILLMPARSGTSVIAGGAVRSVIEAVGIKNILTKIIGTNNKVSNVKATIEALQKVAQMEKK